MRSVFRILTGRTSAFVCLSLQQHVQEQSVFEAQSQPCWSGVLESFSVFLCFFNIYHTVGASFFESTQTSRKNTSKMCQQVSVTFFQLKTDGIARKQTHNKKRSALVWSGSASATNLEQRSPDIHTGDSKNTESRVFVHHIATIKSIITHASHTEGCIYILQSRDVSSALR